MDTKKSHHYKIVYNILLLSMITGHTNTNVINKVTFSVMPTCSASFFKKDSRQAGMTIVKVMSTYLIRLY